MQENLVEREKLRGKYFPQRHKEHKAIRSVISKREQKLTGAKKDIRAKTAQKTEAQS